MGGRKKCETLVVKLLLPHKSLTHVFHVYCEIHKQWLLKNVYFIAKEGKSVLIVSFIFNFISFSQLETVEIFNDSTYYRNTEAEWL